MIRKTSKYSKRNITRKNSKKGGTKGKRGKGTHLLRRSPYAKEWFGGKILRNT